MYDCFFQPSYIINHIINNIMMSLGLAQGTKWLAQGGTGRRT